MKDGVIDQYSKRHRNRRAGACKGAAVRQDQDGRLDVYDPEPPCADNPLLKLDNCIMTPHIAGQAANGLQRIGYNCYCQLLHFLAGERMQGEITRDMLNHIA